LFFGFSTVRFGGLILEPIEPLLRLLDPRHELRLREDSLFVGVDEPADAPPNGRHASLKLVVVAGLSWPVQETSLVFSAYCFGITKQRANVAPNSGVQTIHPHLLVVANAVSSEQRETFAP